MGAVHVSSGPLPLPAWSSPSPQKKWTERKL